jgi:acyl-CoA synthetase (AMP-forming)/AMP-acid ligase II
LIVTEPEDRARVLGRNEVGQIWVRDPVAERFEYWGAPAKTAEAWRGDAYSVGDLGSVDPDGYLWLAGRKHDVIISGGVNVYPQEVEHTLLEHPDVAETVVVGAAHDEWGQQVRALIVAAPGSSPDPEALRAWARERLAGYKCPRVVELVASLPRTTTGKLRRRF